MARESDGKRRRRLTIVGLVIALIPMTSAPRQESTCDPEGSIVGSLVCAPIEVVQMLGPLVRYLLA